MSTNVDYTGFNILRDMVANLVTEYSTAVLNYRKVRDGNEGDKTINRERKMVRDLATLELTDDDSERLNDLMSSIAETIRSEMADADMPGRFGAHVIRAIYSDLSETIISDIVATEPVDVPSTDDVWSHELFASKRAQIDSLFTALSAAWPNRNEPVDYSGIPVKVADKTGNVLLNIPKAPKAESSASVKVESAVTKRVELWKDEVCLSYKSDGEFQSPRYALQLIDAYLTPKVINDQLKAQGKSMAHSEWVCEIPAKFGGGFLHGKSVKV